MDNEPNNTIEQAVLLDLDTVPFTTKIQEKGDVDWFKIKIPEQGYYSIMSSNVPEGLKLQVKFSEYKQWEGSKEKDISSWLDIPATIHFPDSGTYYYVLIDDYNDAASPNAITLKTQFIKEFDKFEMNDNVASAKTINIDQTLQFNIYPKGDNDWFKIEEPKKKGYVKVMIKEQYEGVKPMIKFVQYNEWSDNKISDLLDWTNFPAAISIPEKGDIYFYISDDYNDAATTKPYTLKVEYLAEMDTLEPNNTYKMAKEVKRGDTLSIAIFPKADADWFKMTINEGDSVQFLSKDWGEVIAPKIKIFTLNENGELVEYADWDGFPRNINVTKETTYYFTIQDDYNDACSEDTFYVVIK